MTKISKQTSRPQVPQRARAARVAVDLWRSAIGLVDVECRDLLDVLTERVRKALEHSWRRVPTAHIVQVRTLH